MVAALDCVLDGETTTSGPHSVPMNGGIEIPDLPVDSDCDITVLSMPDGISQT